MENFNTLLHFFDKLVLLIFDILYPKNYEHFNLRIKDVKNAVFEDFLLNFISVKSIFVSDYFDMLLELNFHTE